MIFYLTLIATAMSMQSTKTRRMSDNKEIINEALDFYNKSARNQVSLEEFKKLLKEGFNDLKKKIKDCQNLSERSSIHLKERCEKSLRGYFDFCEMYPSSSLKYSSTFAALKSLSESSAPLMINVLLCRYMGSTSSEKIQKILDYLLLGTFK